METCVSLQMQTGYLKEYTSVKTLKGFSFRKISCVKYNKTSSNNSRCFGVNQCLVSFMGQYSPMSPPEADVPFHVAKASSGALAHYR